MTNPERDRELEFARARAARRLAKLHPKDFERLTIEELAKDLPMFDHVEIESPGLHTCTGCGLELDGDDLNHECDECAQ